MGVASGMGHCCPAPSHLTSMGVTRGVARGDSATRIIGGCAHKSRSSMLLARKTYCEQFGGKVTEARAVHLWSGRRESANGVVCCGALPCAQTANAYVYAHPDGRRQQGGVDGEVDQGKDAIADGIHAYGSPPTALALLVEPEVRAARASGNGHSCHDAAGKDKQRREHGRDGGTRLGAAEPGPHELRRVLATEHMQGRDEAQDPLRAQRGCRQLGGLP